MAMCLYLNGEGSGSAPLRWEEKQLQVTELATAALLFTLPSGWILLLALHLSGPILKFPLRYVKRGLYRLRSRQFTLPAPCHRQPAHVGNRLCLAVVCLDTPLHAPICVL